ncbi:MAG: CDP-alcohol phosphatidyltransferase family protein [bacterium]|nr:CDP-alcohol phosphatidyltransferase family protein [bacterium]
MNAQPFFDRILAATVLRMIPRQVTPNHVTVFRFAATPIVLYCILIGQYQWGLLAFMIVSFSDAVDGALARTRNQVTEWGKLYDPLADKLLIASMVLGVVVRELNLVLGLTIVAIEAAILGLAWYGHSHGRSMQANRWGKMKMTLEVAGVSVLLLGLAFGIPETLAISQATFVVAILFALISLITYGI